MLINTESTIIEIIIQILMALLAGIGGASLIMKFIGFFFDGIKTIPFIHRNKRLRLEFLENNLNKQLKKLMVYVKAHDNCWKELTKKRS